MTTKGKIVLTILILGIAAFGVFRWKDKLAPQTSNQQVSINVDEVKKAVQAAKNPPVQDIPLLAGTNAATLVDRSAIPAVTGVSDYAKSTKDGKVMVEF